MQSVILDFFVGIFKKLADYLPYSILGRVFFAFCDFVYSVLSGSIIGRFFRKTTNEQNIFEGSLFCRLLLLPVKIAEKLGKKVGDSYQSVRSESKFLYLIDNWSLITTKAYGAAFLPFGVIYGLLSLAMGQWNKTVLLISVIAILPGIVFFIADKSLLALFNGSSLLQSVVKIFCKKEEKEYNSLFSKNETAQIKSIIPSLITGAIFGILCAVLSPVVLLIPIGVIFLIVVFKYTHFGVFLTAIASPVLPTMVLAGLCILCFAVFLFRFIKEKNLKFLYSPLYVPTVVFAITYLIGTVTSLTFVSSAKILMLHLAFMIFYVVLYNYLKDEKTYKVITSLFVVMGGIIALYGLIQNFFGIMGTESWVDENMFQNIKMRVYSTFGNPNVLGEFLVLSIPLALAFTIRSEKTSHRIFYFCILAVMSACMILTWSRGAWLGIMLAIMIFLVLTDRRWLLCALIIVVVIPFIPVILNSNSAIIGRFTSIGNMADTSTAYRVSIWRSTIEIIKDHWISGIGPGSDAFSMVYQGYAASGAEFALHSHNLYLQLITELGIGGIIVFAALIISFLKISAQNIFVNNKNTLKSSISIACVSGIAGLLLQGLTDYIWYNYKLLLIFWIILAIGSASASDDVHKSGGVAK